jgi:low affinity Fe/Cu permease
MAHSSVFVIQVIAWALTGRCVLVSNVQKLSTSIQTGFVYIKFISKLMIQNKTITEHL